MENRDGNYARISERMASESPPGHSITKTYISGSREIFWEARLAFLRHVWEAIFRVGLWGQSDGTYAGFERYQGKDGVMARDVVSSYSGG